MSSCTITISRYWERKLKKPICHHQINGQVFNTMPLVHILILSSLASLCKMVRRKVNNLFVKKNIYQFQVECVSYLKLRQNNALKEQLDRFLPHQFDQNIIETLNKICKYYSTTFLF